MDGIIQVTNLTREYVRESGFFKKRKQKITAVKNISFAVKEGQIFGLLGQNGAGKTTVIKILTTMLLPTSGSCIIDNDDVSFNEKNIRKKINYIFGGELGFYRRLSAYDNLVYFAILYKLPPHEIEIIVPNLLELVDLTSNANDLVETFSKGMIQRLQIARGLLNSPKILFMDEPTIGLDVLGARKLHEIILELKEKGVTILLTTHYLHEAEELCDYISIMNRGEIIKSGTVSELISAARDLHPNRIHSLEDAYVTLLEGDYSYVEIDN